MNKSITCFPVSIVGTGPGDPDLLTVRAARVISEADIIMYDCDPAGHVLTIAPASAKIVRVDRHAVNSPASHFGKDSILDLIVTHYRQGKKVVRLKVGDPMLFGGKIEECHALRRMEIPFEVVPGITAGASAANTYALSISTKYKSNAVIYLIADEILDDYALVRSAAALLNHGSTLVLYMANEHLQEIFRVLRDEGVPVQTPVIAIGRSSLPDECFASYTLQSAVHESGLQAVLSPSVWFIGRHISIGNIPAHLKQKESMLVTAQM